jgi:hypothetical protein
VIEAIPIPGLERRRPAELGGDEDEVAVQVELAGIAFAGFVDPRREASHRVADVAAGPSPARRRKRRREIVTTKR